MWHESTPQQWAPLSDAFLWENFIICSLEHTVSYLPLGTFQNCFCIYLTCFINRSTFQIIFSHNEFSIHPADAFNFITFEIWWYQSWQNSWGGVYHCFEQVQLSRDQWSASNCAEVTIRSTVSWGMGEVTEDWKRASVVPIFKRQMQGTRERQTSQPDISLKENSGANYEVVSLQPPWKQYSDN